MRSEFAGYSLPDHGTPFPGGVSYSTVHPTTGEAVLLRVVRADWLAPADTVDAFTARLRTCFSATHDHLLKLIDAGVHDGQPYAVTESFAGANLETLVRDIGPMPTFLAARFVRQAALAVDAIHDRGLIHGDIRPVHLTVGPTVATSKTRPDGTPIVRPTPDAIAKLTDFGLVPLRPAGREWAALDPLATKTLAFLTPERVDVGTSTAAGDLYGLGATLFFLLTGRAPFVANSAAAVVDAIAANAPAPLGTLRPDLPVGLVELVMRLLAKNPAERPAATDVAGSLIPYTEPDPIPLTAVPPVSTAAATESTGGWTVQAFDGHTDDHTPTYAPAAAEGHHDDFADAHQHAAAAPVERKVSRMTDADRQKLKTWFIIGGIFWGLALLLWIVLLSQSGCFKSSTPAEKSSEPKSRRNR
jgi:eukaryotic-like serine/threonine-protein kinase